MKRLSIFSWGYWGWGNATQQLVSAMDAAEKKQGFRPPIFVDIRLRRAVRAVGFSGSAFEGRVGSRRYRWMPALGNTGIATGGPMRIADPKAVAQLLDLALESSRRSIRVIFFCACESPWVKNCHRNRVAKYLKSEALRRHLSVDISEWPGGRPAADALTLRVSPEILRAVRRGAKAVPLRQRQISAKFAGLPWGTLVILKAGSEELLVAVGPIAFQAGRWVLPRFQGDETEPVTGAQALRRHTGALRRRFAIG